MPKGDRDIGKADPLDGTTPIANLLLEAIAMANLSGKKRGALSFLWRRTYGWEDKEKKKVGQRYPRKTEDEISLREWALAVKTDVAYASRIVEDLCRKKIIERDPLGTGKGYRYRLNTRVNEWDNSCINLQELYKLTKQGLFKKTRLPLYKSATPPDTDLTPLKESLKESIKERGALSDYTFEMFSEDRNELKEEMGFNFSAWISEGFEAGDLYYDWGGDIVQRFSLKYGDYGDIGGDLGDDFGARFLDIVEFLGSYCSFLMCAGLTVIDEETGTPKVKDEVIKNLLDSYPRNENRPQYLRGRGWYYKEPPSEIPPPPSQKEEEERKKEFLRSIGYPSASRLVSFALEPQDETRRAKAFKAMLPVLKE